MSFRHYYKSGDLIRYYDFFSKNKDHHKPRPAMVLGYNKKNNSVFAVRITSKGGRTEKPDYKELGDEVRVPKGIVYNDKPLYGVIKTNNIIEIKRDRITSTLDVFPYQTKLEVLQVYEKFKNEDWYKEFLEASNLDYKHIIERYKENLVAEKLGFFYCHGSNENIYEFIQDTPLRIHNIQLLEKKGRTSIFGVLFNKKGKIYDYNIATKKPLQKIVHDWSGNKKVSEWLREDEKFHILMKHVNARIIPDPVPKIDKYKTFPEFKHSLMNSREKENIVGKSRCEKTQGDFFVSEREGG